MWLGANIYMYIYIYKCQITDQTTTASENNSISNSFCICFSFPVIWPVRQDYNELQQFSLEIKGVIITKITTGI